MSNIPAQGSGGSGSSGGGGGGSSYKSVEFVPISNGSTVTIGGRKLPGTVEVQQSGGVNAPTKRTEEGYDYTTRVNRQAREATITGWVDSETQSRLSNLRNEKEPFAVVAGVVVLQRATLDDLTETQSGEYKSGVVEVEISIREAFQAQAGTSNVVAFASSGKKSPGIVDHLFAAGEAGYEVATGDYAGAAETVSKTYGSSTGNTE